MKAMNKTECRKILSVLSKNKSRKFISIDDISSWTGFYPDVVGEYFSFFNPMASLDPSFNCKDVEGDIQNYLDKLEARSTTQKKTVVTKKTLSEYSSISDFVYKKMTYRGGLVDPSGALNDEDLAILKKLVLLETERRKKERRKARKLSQKAQK
jgi:hypothetical protein